MHILDRLNVYLFHRNKSLNGRSLNYKMQGWSSEKEQIIRFKAIANSADFSNKRVLDLGCGLGELYDYLSQDKHLAFYLGIDQHWPFLKRAKKRIGSVQCRFRLADISRTPLPELDIIIASGSLNYQSRQTDYLERMITRMYAAAKEVVIFNLLNKDVFLKPTLLKAYDKNDVLSFCHTLTPKVRVIDDYSTGDFTIVLEKS
ncbi:class I SAM-dependent methyltransferase [Vibrio aquimaris]|uniref:Trans-aconitate 2-methyltransferase n=1 Tax=Vibrio aquimaris TaxID=2587862 RepID=A0A5P9CHR9_9VIBR|nr:class I SAM-dependent methyltransferase [Vibrio aquimaris]QFT25785.1 trans-aconitate 2-methyltransferase [Vibrio aquimaris]